MNASRRDFRRGECRLHKLQQEISDGADSEWRMAKQHGRSTGAELTVLWFKLVGGGERARVWGVGGCYRRQ